MFCKAAFNSGWYLRLVGLKMTFKEMIVEVTEAKALNYVKEREFNIKESLTNIKEFYINGLTC
jgi:uncharacterized membrane protein